MAVTLNELTVLTLRRLDQAMNSHIADVSAGTGIPYAIDATTWAAGGVNLDTIEDTRQFLNRAQVEWCETAFYLRGTATKTWVAGTASHRLNDLTPAGGQGNLWSLEAVSTTAGTETLLTRLKHNELMTHFPNYLLASGVPTYWCQEQSTLELDKKPSADTAMKFYGLALPPSMASGGSASFMEDEHLRMVLPLMAAIFIARRRFSDPDAYGRLPDLIAEYQDHYLRSRAAMSPEVLRQHFREMSPDLAQQKGR